MKNNNFVIGRLKDRDEFLEVVPMLREAYKETFSFMEVRSTLEYGEWLLSRIDDKEFDLFVIKDKDKDEIIGLSIGSVNHVYYVQDHYFIDMVYVKKEYRTTNAVFLLLQVCSRQAYKRKMPILASLFTGKNNTLPPIAKRFADEKKADYLIFHKIPTDKDFESVAAKRNYKKE